MPTPRKLTASALITGLLAVATWLFSQAFADGGGYRLKGTDICIPDEYAVPLPTASGSRANDYDSSDGYGVSASIHRREVAQAIHGYKEVIKVNGRRRYEGIYLSLHPASRESLEVEVEDPATLTRIDQVPDLFIQDFDPTPLAMLEVLEKEGETYRQWGHCFRSLSRGGDVVLECDRYYLRVGPLRIDHSIDGAQLHLHDEIDQFISDKIRQWRCQ